MVVFGLQTMTAGSLSSCIAGANPEGSHNHPTPDARALAQGRLSLLPAL
jgi:hypothetical protein